MEATMISRWFALGAVGSILVLAQACVVTAGPGGCLADGDSPCNVDSDCCSGLCDASGTCQPAGSCIPDNTGPCEVDSDCCSGACDPSSMACLPAATDCAASGDTCSTDGDCCNGFCD